MSNREVVRFGTSHAAPDEEDLANRSNFYIGRAGQLAVMAEFLLRGWNVALPEVDVGDDVFVVKDEGGDLFESRSKQRIPKDPGPFTEPSLPSRCPSWRHPAPQISLTSSSCGTLPRGGHI